MMEVNYFVGKLPKHVVPTDLRAVVENNLIPWPGMKETSKQYLQLLRAINAAKQVELSMKNYAQMLKLALYVEEIKNEIDLKDYDMFRQKLGIKTIAGDDYVEIYVETLEEEKPSVVVNNKIEIVDVATGDSYILYVRKIFKQYIYATPELKSEFFKNFKKSNKYNVKFIFNAYTFSCSHHALQLIYNFNIIPYLFPTCRPNYDNLVLTKDLKWFNSSLAKNPEQCQAVINILNKSSGNYPYILYGPPGTGKTATIIEAICQASYDSSCNHILVCTPSNEAADVITKRLFPYMLKKYLHRMYSYAKDPETIDKEILDCCNCIERDGRKEIITFPAKKLPKIVITTLCSATRLLLMNLNETFFSYVFIDEAGQATEAEVVIPFALLSNSSYEAIGRVHGQMVLAGDPQQLGPVIFSKFSEKILGISMLERLLKFPPYRKDNNTKYNPRFITKLIRNYRSHVALIQVSNDLFYGSELLCCNNKNNSLEGWDGLHNPNFPINFDDVRGKETKDHRSPSSYNEVELTAVMRYVDRLVGIELGGKRIGQEDIGIITPFTAQKVRLKKLLEESCLKDIEVGTVQLFQGKEKEVIIYSTVRSEIFTNSDHKPHIGFLSNAKRFNVALTRAKSLQIIVGNQSVLSVDDNWSHLINYCHDNNAYSGCPFPIKYVKLKGKKKKKQNNYPFANLLVKDNKKKAVEYRNTSEEALDQSDARSIKSTDDDTDKRSCKNSLSDKTNSNLTLNNSFTEICKKKKNTNLKSFTPRASASSESGESVYYSFSDDSEFTNEEKCSR